MADKERRSAPRVTDDSLSLQLKLDGFDTIVHTINLSASGIYCKVPREIPLMSRVKLFLLPNPSKDAKPVHPVEVDGVVVREHPVIINGEIKHYDVAIFFDNPSPETKEIISEHIAKKKS